MGYDIYSKNGDYYRLNIWGMGTMRYILDELDTLGPEQPLGWPKEPENLPEDWQESDDPTAVAYRDQLDARRAATLTDGRVSVEKFSTNDGWLVTSEECAMLAEKLRAITDDQLATALSRSELDSKLSSLGFDVQRGELSRQEAEARAEELVKSQQRPSAAELADWHEGCREFVEFLEKSAACGGCEVW